MLTTRSLPAVQEALRDAALDGWLIFDFHGVNPIASGLLGWEGMVSRRHFAFIPARGLPVALSHAIEAVTWRRWPQEWDFESYSTWRELQAHLANLVGARRIAMEYSPGGGVPYVDRVPAGVLEMIRATGAQVVSSGELVSRFFAVLDDQAIAAHRDAAELLAHFAREGIAMAGARARTSTPMQEHELQQWILEQFATKSLATDHGPIVAAAENAANPHYLPSAERARPITPGDVLLVDLFAKAEGGVHADQTWMASVGEPSPRALEVWGAVRDARDAAIDALRDAIASGRSPSGGSIDDAARAVIRARGFGDYFIHRTGHSIDAHDLHGSGPHLDNYETREERALIPGVAFSIEPGVYIPGEIGMRSEVNGVRLEHELLVTPAEYQRELLIV